MYRTVDTSFWTDPKIRAMKKEGKFLCLYLITCPHGHVGGIYHLPDEFIALETGLDLRVLDTLWDTLSSAGFARRDKELGVVWVIKQFFHQGRGEKNERAVANHLGTLHNSRLVNDFLHAYPSVKRWLKDRVSIGYPALDEIGTQEQEKDQDQEKNKSSTKSSHNGTHSALPSQRTKPNYCSAFEAWWTAYPRHEGKQAASAAWVKAGKRLRADRGMTAAEAAAYLHLRAVAYAASPRATASDLSLVPHPATWLNQARYEDDDAAWQMPLLSGNGRSNHASLDLGIAEMEFGR